MIFAVLPDLMGWLRKRLNLRMTYLKNYSPMPGIVINGKIDTIEFQKIQLTNKAIVAFVKVNGNVKVAVDGLK